MTLLFRRAISQMSIAFTVPKLWNSIEDSIKNLTTLFTFKESLNCYLVDQYQCTLKRGKIQCIQRRASKLLENLPPQVRHPLPFDHLYVYNVAIQFQRLLLGLELKPYFHHRITDLMPDHSYHTRSGTNDKLLLLLRKAVS